MQTRTTAWDYIFLARPILLIPVWAFLLLGYYRAGGARFHFNVMFYYVMIAYTCLLAALYILNQIADRESDRINQKHLLIAEGHVPVRNAYLEIIALSVITILVCTKLPLIAIILMAVSLLFGVAYSFPPFKLKAIAFGDLLVNGIGYGFLNFALGWLTLMSFSVRTILFALPYVFAVSAIFVNTTILDIEGDRKCNFKTTGVVLGSMNSARLGLLLIAACIASAIYVRDLICLIPALLSLPLFVLAAISRDQKYVLLSIRIGGPLLILVAGFIFPYFLAMVALIFVFLRIYYKRKFGITYPAL